ncbi:MULTISPECIES: hypothetical protein [unclassified Treponema]|nr:MULTISPECIES: hypothetical protein [unclassified Treponema]
MFFSKMLQLIAFKEAFSSSDSGFGSLLITKFSSLDEYSSQ